MIWRLMMKFGFIIFEHVQQDIPNYAPNITDITPSQGTVVTRSERVILIYPALMMIKCRMIWIYVAWNFSQIFLHLDNTLMTLLKSLNTMIISGLCACHIFKS